MGNSSRKGLELLGKLRDQYGLPLVKEMDVGYGKKSKWQVSEDHKAIVDVKTQKLFGIHSDGYRLVQHEEGIVLLQDAIKKNPEFGKAKYDVKLFDEGRRAKITARFPEVEFPVTKKPGDVTNPTLEYFNSYDGGWAEKVILGAYRLVCKNGLVVGKKFFTQSIVHKGESESDRFLEGIDQAMDNFSMQVGLWKEWANRKLSTDEINSGVSPFSKRQREEILTDVEVDNRLRANMTTWIFYNLLTTFITHKVVSLRKQVKLQDALRRSVERW